MIDYTVEDEDGDVGKMTTNGLIQLVKSQGENVVGMSPDGQTLHIQDAQGGFELPIDAAMQANGYKVHSATPQNVDYSMVAPGLRAAIHAMPQNDDIKKEFLKNQLAHNGLKDAKVMGSGRDFYAFSPQTGKYHALTNTPGWDMGDLAEFGMEAPRAIGATLGGVGGSFVEPGLGTVAGAGIGGAGVDMLERAALARAYPAYADSMHAHQGDYAWDVGMRGALDAGTAGILKGAPVLIGKVAPELGRAAAAAVRSGPISSAMKAGGRAAEFVGDPLAAAAGAVRRSPIGRTMAASTIPGVATADTAAFMAQGPAAAVKGGVKAAGWAGESDLLKKYAPGVADKLRSTASDLSRSVPKSPGGFRSGLQGGAEKIGKALGGDAGAEEAWSPTAESILGRAGNRVGRAFHDWRSGPAPTSRLNVPTDVGAFRGARMAREFQFEKPSSFGRTSKWFADRKAAAARGAATGRKVGRAFDTVGDLGKATQRTVEGVGSGILGGVELGAKAASRIGTGARALGTVTAPLEARNALRYGAEEAYGQDLDDLNPWRRRQRRAMMAADFADN